MSTIYWSPWLDKIRRGGPEGELIAAETL